VREIIMKNRVKLQTADKEILPRVLLLMADPSPELVSKYLEEGDCYPARIGDSTVGVCVLTAISSEIVELKNIAVEKTRQGQGIGKSILCEVSALLKQKGVSTLEAGTGSSSFNQLAFYQKAGFRITDVVPEFFTDNYQEEISENGIRCRDMIRLALDLTQDSTLLEGKWRPCKQSRHPLIGVDAG